MCWVVLRQAMIECNLEFNIVMSNLHVRVGSVRRAAQDVAAVVLLPRSGERLPPFSAGAHIDVVLPLPGGAVVRQYSLCNDAAEDGRYVIGVARSVDGRGGSRWLLDHLREGDDLEIGVPRNSFPLQEAAPNTVLIAGGIGITPLLAMARRLAALGRSWTLYYCVRTPQRAAFLGELMALGPTQVIPVYDGVDGVTPLRLDRVVAAAPAGTHFYCCGPAGLIAAFREATTGRPADHVHVEWFAPPPPAPQAQPPAQDFGLRLARSQRELRVAADESILDALLAAGIDVPYSCRTGVCATCETRVLEGACDHRDFVLPPEEAASNGRIMICVSRAKGGMLTLDL
jgi:vanillate O-demethylase ferredoxin subunit